jgi:RNA polymerase sigma-70 factor (ECF subfamily)
MHAEGASGGLSSGDRELLGTWVQTLGPRVVAYVHRLVGDAHEAEDLASETFVRAARHMDKLRAMERPEYYLLTIARNLCRDRFRRTVPALRPPEALDERAGAGELPGEVASGAEMRAQLQVAVGQLPPHLREIVVLRMSSELTFEEIAQLLEIPLGTALSRMHSALRHLRRALEVEAS